MIFRSGKQSNENDVDKHVMEMIDRTQAVIHFKPDGTIITANKNFLDTLGYTLDEIAGQHHSMFVESAYIASAEYKQFWQTLAGGDFMTNQFPRVRKDKSIVWIQATYAPVLDETGKVERVVKLATNVSHRRSAIEQIASALDELSDGNLGHHLETTGIPDMDAINVAFNRASQQLSNTMQMMTKVSADVTKIITQVSASSDQLSSRTTGQAATLEETAAALEELTVTVKSSADGAREAEQMAAQTKLSAESSEEVVGRSIEAMAQIQESSSKISKIISVIDDISFQTNLLALNAGVEAARAGDAGRGFAVVASEVRGLAHRSQEAAGEIKQLISESTKHVSNGVDLVNGAGEELKKIISSVNTITDKVSGIASSAAEQSTALNEVNISVGHLDTATQQNASMVEEVTAANHTLTENVSRMSEQIDLFRVGQDGGQNYKPPADQWRRSATG